MPCSNLTTGWLPLPNGVAADRPAFALSDVHGHAPLLRRALDFAEAASGGHELVVLGDITDRGADSLGCVRAVLAARLSGRFSRVVTLMGNHDEVLSGYAQAPEDEAARSNVVMMGGRGLLAQIAADPGAMTDIEAYVRGLVPHHRNGGLVMVHALPDPGLPLSRQKDSTLFWNAGNQEYRGGWDALIGAPAVLVHGHVRNGVTMKGRTEREVEDDLFEVLARHRRMCCDVGTPWTDEAALFEFAGDCFRVHGFW